MKAPTHEEVQHYCLTRRNGIDAQAFIDYYESVGWKVGKSRKPMISWEAAVRTWERSRKPSGQQEFINKHTDTSWADEILNQQGRLT